MNLNHLDLRFCHLLDNNGKGLCFQLALENGDMAARMRNQAANNVGDNIDNIQAFERQLRRSPRIDLHTVIPRIADNIWNMKETYDRSILSPYTIKLLDDFREEVCKKI